MTIESDEFHTCDFGLRRSNLDGAAAQIANVESEAAVGSVGRYIGDGCGVEVSVKPLAVERYVLDVGVSEVGKIIRAGLGPYFP